MDERDASQAARERLKLRLQLFRFVTQDLSVLAEHGGKVSVANFLAEHFSLVPISKGNQLVFMDWILTFNDDGQLIDVASEIGLAGSTNLELIEDNRRKER